MGIWNGGLLLGACAYHFQNQNEWFISKTELPKSQKLGGQPFIISSKEIHGNKFITANIVKYK